MLILDHNACMLTERSSADPSETVFQWAVPLEQDCTEIVLYSVLKSMRKRLSDGSALDRPLRTTDSRQVLGHLSCQLHEKHS